MKDGLLNTIKSRGYWRINFQPTGKPMNLTLKECENVAGENSVKLRGWYFPFYRPGSADNYGIENHNNYCLGWIDSGQFKEFWHMYKSGQFLHYSAVHEDWMTLDTRDARLSPNEVGPGKYLSFIGSLTYYITEIMEFLTRLNKAGLYQEGVTVYISLHNTKGRELVSFEVMRHLSYARVTQEDDILFERTYTSQELEVGAKELAIEPIVHFFELFNFGDVSVDQVIRQDQETLYGLKMNG